MMSFNVGENIGPYRIIEQLGQGGMASVFKAYHAALDRYVAIKVLHPAINQDPNFEARFQREARVVAKLEHPNIVPVYDYAEHEKRPYLIMKFVEGQTLKARMDQGALTSDEVTRIVDAVGSALAYAHKQGVLHRDIKPSNVLLTNDGQIYLADFGLARMAQAGESTLSSDMMMGTPQYISPEQAMGIADLDQRTDLYSFGVMLYEMVVGKVPFSADTPFSIIHDHIYSPLPLPRTVNADVPEEVERVLLKALAKERDDRFEDAVKMTAAFKQAWNDAGVPIQVSDVNAPQALRAEENTVAPQAEPTRVASAPTKVAEDEENAGEQEAAPNPKKKRSIWKWAAAVFGIFLCFIILVNAGNDRRNNNAGGTGDQPVLSDGGQSDRDLPPHVAEAEVFAQENPDDLGAQLNLVLVYLDEGMQKQFYERIPDLVKQAGPDDKEFYIHAGNEFAIREAWIAASAMYFQAVRSFQQDGHVPDDIINQFHEAVYKGAEFPEANALLQSSAIEEVDPPISLIAKARHELFNGRVEEGRVFLNQAKRMDPGMAEIIMLQAEFDRHDGNFLEARNAAKELSSNPSIPEWIRIFADEFLKRTL
ncbi:MAG: serine/threonine-protein kinase [Anaerolineales bacterium]|nr:serine/threonine-protein kinase [Anaerolineales bacterium]